MKAQTTEYGETLVRKPGKHHDETTKQQVKWSNEFRWCRFDDLMIFNVIITLQFMLLDDFIFVSQVMVKDKLDKIEETTNSFQSTFNEDLQATSDVQFFQGECFIMVFSCCLFWCSESCRLLECHYMHQSPKSFCIANAVLHRSFVGTTEGRDLITRKNAGYFLGQHSWIEISWI